VGGGGLGGGSMSTKVCPKPFGGIKKKKTWLAVSVLGRKRPKSRAAKGRDSFEDFIPKKKRGPEIAQKRKSLGTRANRANKKVRYGTAVRKHGFRADGKNRLAGIEQGGGKLQSPGR